MPTAPGESFLRTAQTAGQDRSDDAGEEAHRSALGSEYGGEFQAAGHDRADAAAEVAISDQQSANPCDRMLSAECLLNSPPNPNFHLKAKPRNFLVATK